MHENTPISPGLRLFDLLEVLVREARPLTLAEAVAASGWPKPTVHRLLAQLEAGGLLAREPDGRRYALAPRLLRLAEATLAGSTQHKRKKRGSLRAFFSPVAGQRPALLAAAEQQPDANGHQHDRPPGEDQLPHVHVGPAQIAGQQEQADEDQDDGGDKVGTHQGQGPLGLGRIS